MLEKQFLTAFNKIKTFTPNTLQRDRKNNFIFDFINASYQGLLNPSMNLQGVGTIVDDQFNFITCSNWKNGKIHGSVFMRLADQTLIWGEWKDNLPQNFSSVKMGQYCFIIPYGEKHGKIKRPKKCLIIHEGKAKAYVATIQRYPQNTQTKREYSIVIEKVIPLGGKQLRQIADAADIDLNPHEENCISFLGYMEKKLGTVLTIEQKNGYFITANFGDQTYGLGLGILLDRKKLTTKTVGMFLIKKQEKQDNQENYEVSVNGLALSMTMQKQKIIGIFKDNMLVREINTVELLQSVRSSHSRNNTIENNAIKQVLSHQHMRSLNYQHNYVYFPQVKRIMSISNELFKYVEMFQRLSHQKQSQIQESMDHHVEKYENSYTIRQDKQNNKRQWQSNDTIIDQFAQMKIDLKKQIYHLTENKKPHPNPSQSNNLTIQQQYEKIMKRPGFIVNRSHNNNSVRSRSPSTSPNPIRKPKVKSPLKSQSSWRV